jgi:hypothetical protein
MAKKQEVYAPMFAHPHFKWWTPWGACALLARTSFRYFVTGREIRGEGDNATWLHDATVDYRGKPYEKLTRARWRRVARRWVIAGVPGLLTVAYLMAVIVAKALDPDPTWTRVPYGWLLFGYVAVGTATGTVWIARALGLWWSVRAVRKTYIYPAAKVLSAVTGRKLRKRDMLAAIELPDRFGEEVDDEPLPVRVYVPDVALDASMKKRIVENVGSRLGLPGAVSAWTEAGVPVRYVELLPQALPPKSVTLADLMEELLAGDMDHPLVGVRSGGRISRMDMKNDSPHTLGSAGSGAGKSTLYKLIAMQRLRLGAYAIILDFKKWSHLRWAGRLPAGRVRIEDEVPAIHDILCKVLDELLWRKSFNLDQEDDLERLPTVDIFVEEINTLMSLLVDYWTAETAKQKQEARTRLRRAREAIKDAGADGEAPDVLLEEEENAEAEFARAMGLPKTSPAVQALRYGVNLGREFKIHFHFIGQSVSAKAAGGRDTRESFRTRLLARWDAKTWKMLADGIPFVACPSGEVGIWAHVHGGQYEIVRVPYVPDASAVEYVLAGERPSLPMFHDDPAPTIDAEPSVPEIAQAMSLSGLVEILPCKADGDRMTLNALRVAANRSDSNGFPEPLDREYGPREAKVYDPAEVLAWFRDRERLPTLY